MSTQRRFMSHAETLCPFPDGFRVSVESSSVPNPALLHPGVSYPAALLLNGSTTSFHSTVQSLRVDADPTPHWTGSSLGYWSVTYTLLDGTRVGSSKVMPPRGKDSPTFQSIVDTLVANAALQSFSVSHILYYDRDFEAFALLAPHTAQFSTDQFDIIVQPITGRLLAREDGPMAPARVAPPVVSDMALHDIFLRPPPAVSGSLARSEAYSAIVREETASRSCLTTEESTCRLTMLARCSVQAKAMALAEARQHR